VSAAARRGRGVSPIPPRAALLALALALGALGLVGSGCGEEDGVADGAVVTAYVEAPLCAGGTEHVTASAPAGDGAFEVRFVCLADPRGKRGIELATVGANARRASEDSSTVAFLELADPPVNRFTHPILEAAGIGWIAAASRAEASKRLLSLLAGADSDALRRDLREELGQG
jgi:hypothetical protein